jgi:hypothetical protein
LKQEQVIALADFYYAQACLYKKGEPTNSEVCVLISKGDTALECLDASD